MITDVIYQLKRKIGFRAAEELKTIHILQTFIATRSIPKIAKFRRNKDDDMDEDKSDGSKRHHMSNKDNEDKKKKYNKRKKDNKRDEDKKGKKTNKGGRK